MGDVDHSPAGSPERGPTGPRKSRDPEAKFTQHRDGAAEISLVAFRLWDLRSTLWIPFP